MVNLYTFFISRWVHHVGQPEKVYVKPRGEPVPDSSFGPATVCGRRDTDNVCQVPGQEVATGEMSFQIWNLLYLSFVPDLKMSLYFYIQIIDTWAVIICK